MGKAGGSGGLPEGAADDVRGLQQFPVLPVLLPGDSAGSSAALARARNTRGSVKRIPGGFITFMFIIFFISVLVLVFLFCLSIPRVNTGRRGGPIVFNIWYWYRYW